jgi:hypothetical protein
MSLLKKLNDKEQGWMVNVSLYLAAEWIDAVESQVQKQNRRNLSVYAGLRRSFCMA